MGNCPGGPQEDYSDGIFPDQSRWQPVSGGGNCYCSPKQSSSLWLWMTIRLLKKDLSLIEMKKIDSERYLKDLALSHLEEAAGLFPMHLLPGSKP